MKRITGLLPLTLMLSSIMVFTSVNTCFANSSDTIVRFPVGATAYIVAKPASELQKRICFRLVDYMGKVIKAPVNVVADLRNVPSKAPAIILSIDYNKLSLANPNASSEAFTLETRLLNSHPVVMATGKTESGLKQAVQRLIIKTEQKETALSIPDLHITESPWIPRREWTLCSWDPTFVRGVFHNPNVDKRVNVFLYSDRQIEDYVNMFDAFGFSGCQLMESANSYATFGSAEGYENRLKKFAKAVHNNGQQVTLWVWAAQFNGYGWIDTSVKYIPSQGYTAFTDPGVRASFEKYYNQYAQMAPYVDMLITHFYDPGSLKDRSDVFNYMRLLQNKFKSKNPQVKFAVDFWASNSDSAYMKELVDNGFKDVLFLESGMPHLYQNGRREALHEQARRQGLSLGVWGWHGIEKETDQDAKMHVNAQVLSNFYRQVRDGAYKIQPISYWSEMEAYHLNNIFSAYAASQLLWNPDRDPDEILSEIALGIWGPRNGPKVLRALQLIQDIRSGPTWDTYWGHKGRIPYYYGTEQPKNDLERAASVLQELESLKTDTAYVPKFPLPFPPSTFIELMLPHIKQIRAFAEFRVKEKAVRDAAGKGASPEELSRMAAEIWKPIPDYNTWIGTYGQPEARAQETMMRQLAKDLKITVATPGWLLHQSADRYLERIQTLQRRSSTPVVFKANDNIGKGEFYWPPEKIEECIDFLVKAGNLVLTDKGYRLANWEDYKP
jgi:hypothetical protein